MFRACLIFNLGRDATHRPGLNRVLHVESVCVRVWAAEGLVAREILTYRAPLPAALSLASTSQRKCSAVAPANLQSLPLVPSRLCCSLFLLSLSFCLCINVVGFTICNFYFSLQQS